MKLDVTMGNVFAFFIVVLRKDKSMFTLRHLFTEIYKDTIQHVICGEGARREPGPVYYD